MNTFDTQSDNYVTKPESYYSNERPEIIDIIPAGLKKFLDVGCSEGSFGAGIKRRIRDAEVWGIEPHEESTKIAEKNIDKIIHGIFTEGMPELQNHQFDCVSFNDVLEHLIDPKEALVLAKKFLRPGGYVIASIPNILFFPVFFKEIILKQDWEYTKSGILDNTHLRFFTEKSIKRLFVNAGFDIVAIDGINKEASMMFKAVNLLTLNFIKSWKYPQYRILAKVKPN